ncbi:hypothetical protein DQ193_09540 [Enterococcus faecium]|nr:hypothetical protein [Enterococcus faecium]
MVTKLTLLRWSILFFDSIVASLVLYFLIADGQNYYYVYLLAQIHSYIILDHIHKKIGLKADKARKRAILLVMLSFFISYIGIIFLTQYVFK